MAIGEQDYLDFDLEVSRGAGDGRYAAQVLASPKGEARVEFGLPFSAAELEILVLKLGRTRSGVRRLGSPQHELARNFGTRLYESVFAGEVGTCLRRSLDEAESRRAGLRIRLRLDEVPELAQVPWEFLYAPALGRFLVLSGRTPVVRYLELPRAVPALPVAPPLHVLLAVAGPSDLASLDSAREVERITTALAELIERGLVVVDPLPSATLAELRRMLRRTEYHVLHFVGHGGFDETSGEGVLAFEDEHGKSHTVAGEDLATMLHDVETLRLVVLNACEGGRQSSTDPFSGVAQSLVRQGLPAVIAMQFEITDVAAQVFGHELYAALADGYPIDAALAQARLAIFSEHNDIEWGTPVLYLRARDGRIFDVHPDVHPEADPRPPAATSAPPPPRRPRRRTRWLVTAATLVVAVVAGLAWLGSLPDDTGGGEGEASGIPSVTRTAVALAGAAAAPRAQGVPLVALHAPIQIDGNLDDWTGPPTGVSQFLVSGSPSPVRATWRLGYDSEALYFYAQVSDPVLVPADRDNPALQWRGDSVSVMLGPSAVGLADEASLDRTDSVWTVGFTDPGATVHAVQSPAAATLTEFAPGAYNAKTTAVVRTAPGGYLVEGRIPWLATGILGSDGGPGVVLAVNLDVSDAGADNTTNAAIYSTNPVRDDQAGVRPALWQVLELA